MMTPIDTLAQAAREGDRRAFDALMAREKAGVYAFIRRSVGNADDAYDLLQETFVSAWRALGRYDPARPFGVWVRAVALNKCRDFGRRAAVRRLTLAAFAREPRPPAGAEPEDAALRLDAAIAALPRDQREPLLLTTAGELSHEEAARILGLSPKAVEMRLYRARRRLRELIDSEG